MPLLGGEQMYQALRSLGVDTQLVIYPNEFHGITVPSYKVDRLRALPGVVRQVSEGGGHDGGVEVNAMRRVSRREFLGACAPEA